MQSLDRKISTIIGITFTIFVAISIGVAWGMRMPVDDALHQKE